MTLLELAVRGVRHFGGFTRIPLKPGLNTVWGSNQSGKTTLWQVLRLLLVADREVASADDAERWGHAALTFQGEDGHTYCLARHFSEHSERLARHQAGEGFVAVELSPGERGPVDPQAEDEPSLWSACIGGAAWLPSARLRGTSLTASGARPALPLALIGPAEEGEESTGLDMVPVPGEARRAAAERRLEALRHIERAAREAADREGELAACYDRRALLATRLERLARLERERDEADAEMAALEAAARVSDDLARDARAYCDRLAEIRAAQGDLESDIGDLTLDLEGIRPVRPARQPATYGALLLGCLGALAKAAVGWTPVTYGLLAGGALLAGLLAYRVAAAAQRRREIGQRIATLSRQRAALERDLAASHADLFQALRAAGIPSPQALLARRERHREAAARRQRLEARCAELLEGDPPESLAEEAARVDAWIADLEATLSASRVTGADAEAARREQESLERSLRLEPEDPAGTAEPDLSIEPHLAAEPALRAALDRRRDTYCARAGDYLARFTGGEFTRLTVNGTYHPTLHTDREGVSEGRPGAGMVDLIYLAQYLAMIETLDPAGRFPMVLDEPFLSLDPERRTVLHESLREVARGRQVVVFTCQQFLTSPGDHLVRLRG